MVDAVDLKLIGLNSRAGSSPASGTWLEVHGVGGQRRFLHFFQPLGGFATQPRLDAAGKLCFISPSGRV